MQELEKILEEIDDVIKEYSGGTDDNGFAGFRRGLKRAKKIIRKHMNDGWIPVGDRLPEEPPEEVDDEDNLEEYIVMIEGAERPTTLRYAGDGTWWEDGTYYPVIAWRPLPGPYKPPVESAEERNMRDQEELFIGNHFLAKRFLEVR